MCHCMLDEPLHAVNIKVGWLRHRSRYVSLYAWWAASCRQHQGKVILLSCCLMSTEARWSIRDDQGDDSIIHFICHCMHDQPLHAINIRVGWWQRFQFMCHWIPDELLHTINSIIHFIWAMHLIVYEPLHAVSTKIREYCHTMSSLDSAFQFLSLGQRKSFEIAHLRVMLETSSKPSVGSTAMSGQTIDMERLRRDVDSMGDTVSDRAKAFLTTLEHFQKVWFSAYNIYRAHSDSGSVNIGHFQRVWIRIQWIENTFRGCVKDSVIIQRVWFFKKRFFSTGFFVLCKKFGLPYLGKVQQPQEQRYPFLSVCAVFLCTSKQWYGCQCVF